MSKTNDAGETRHEPGHRVPLNSPEQYPAHGHMTVSDDHQAVYWLTDRHAVLESTGGQGVIALIGVGRRLLEARAADGIIDFTDVRDYDGPVLNPATRAGRAFRALLDPGAIERVLFPPYIADALARPRRADLQPPQAPFWKGTRDPHDRARPSAVLAVVAPLCRACPARCARPGQRHRQLGRNRRTRGQRAARGDALPASRLHRLVRLMN